MHHALFDQQDLALFYYPTNKGGKQNGSSVGICTFVLSMFGTKLTKLALSI